MIILQNVYLDTDANPVRTFLALYYTTDIFQSGQGSIVHDYSTSWSVLINQWLL